MTGKKSDSSPSPSNAPDAAQIKVLIAELAWHEEAAASIESRTGQTDTYHHETAARIRAELPKTDEVKDDKLD